MNYYECRNFGIRYKIFLYIDVRDYLADSIFMNHELEVKWVREFSHKKSPYLVIFCKVPKKDVEKFKTVMGELEKKMLICGHRDYSKLAKEIIEDITKGGEYCV